MEMCSWCEGEIEEAYTPDGCDRKYCNTVCAAYEHDEEVMNPHLKECDVRFRISVNVPLGGL
jgi:hypothetical protein